MSGAKASAAEFVNRALESCCEYRTESSSVMPCCDALVLEFRKQGLSGNEITDLLWQNLVAFCERCGKTYDGQALIDRLLAFRSSSRKESYFCCGMGRVTLFWKPRESQGMLQRMVACGAIPPEDVINPDFEGDRSAIKSYWWQSASEWWKSQKRSEAVCDKCFVPISRGDGYHSKIFSDLVCDKCCERRLTPERLKTMYEDKSSVTRRELRLSREVAH